MKSSKTLERKLEEFSEEQRRLIFANTGAIQLTEGCNSACPDCGLGAKRGVRDFISFEFLEDLFQNYNKDLRNVHILYYASEPFDYEDGDKTYADVHRMFTRFLMKPPSVTTSIPKGKEEEITRYILGGEYCSPDRPRINIERISLTKANYNRINEVYVKLIGADPIHPELTLDNWVKKMKQKRKNGIEFLGLSSSLEIFDNYNEDTDGELHTLRLGEKHKENLSERGLGCKHGVLLTPMGVYNMQTVFPSKEYPTGQILTEILPDNFGVIPLFEAGNVGYNKFLKKGNVRLLTSEPGRLRKAILNLQGYKV